MSLNKAMMIGNVGQDPEIRTFQDGGKVANFSLATSETWKDKATGEKKERTEWHRVVVFGPMADVVEQWVTKGSKLYVEGEMRTRKWQDQSGQDRYTTEVVVQGFGTTFKLLGNRQSDQSSGADDRYGGYRDERGAGPEGGQIHDPDQIDDEIPF